MITAVFTSGFDHTEVSGLWQWDYGQKLRIQGLNLPPAVEIHFSLQKSGGDSESRVGVTKDGATDVPIPDSMLENGGSVQNYYIYAFIYITDETSGKTVKWVQLHVNSRPKPEAFDSPEEAELFRETIAAVNDSADRAETAEKSSEAWAHGHGDYPERDEDNAKFYSDKAGKKVEETASILQEVNNLTNQVKENAETVARDKNITEEFKNKTGESAENAAVSESNAALHENNVKEAQTKAETAQRIAEEAKEQVAKDKEEVLIAKTAVEKSEKNVTENKEFVRQTVENFTSLAENAVDNVNVAGQNQVNNIGKAGQAALDNISTGVDESFTQSGKAADAKKTGERIDELKSDIDNIESCSASKIIAKAKDTDESGFNYYYDGSHQDNTYFRTTDFIDVSDYETIKVTDKTTSSSTTNEFNAHICFYDENKQYVSGIHRKVESPLTPYVDDVTIPSNVAYARISYLVNASDIFKVEAPVFICEKVNDNTNKISEIYPIKDAMEHREHSRNWFDATKATPTSESGAKGYISDYIPVVQGDVLYASKNATRYIGGMSDEAFFLVRYYNESKQNISNSDYWQLSVTVPSGVSYARCYVGQVDYARIMIEKNERTNIWEEYWDSGYVSNDVNARKTSDIAIDSFLYGSVSMFNRIGGIGDSFTEGYAKASDGTYNTNKDHSYIGVMAKRAGINYANYGHSGATTRSYLTDKLPSVLSDSICDFYFLALGINDVGLGTSYIGTVADINDDYTQNADTFYGNYGKIIAQVKAHSPKALFCLIKIPLCETNVKAFDSAIDGVGEHFGIPVINPYDDEFFKTSLYENMNDGHPTLLGYTGMALAYERLLSKAIYDNPTYFKFATIG